MNEERIWEQARAWKHGRKFAALCERHWANNYKAAEDKARAARGGFKARRAPPPITKESITKANATKMTKFLKKWQKVMSEINWEGSTGQIADRTMSSSMSIYGSLSKLKKLGLIVAKKGDPGKNRGRQPVIWEWTGDRKL